MHRRKRELYPQHAATRRAGRESVSVAPGSSELYKLHFVPLRSGVFTGTVTFSDASTGQYIWFTLECRASDASEIDTIEVIAAVRSAVEIAVPVSNPSNSRLVMRAIYGHASLVGPPSLVLEPRASEPFRFFFAPLIAGETDTSLKLVHESCGEFCYKLRVTAMAAEREVVPQVEAPVGEATRVPVEFCNPLDRDAVFAVSCSNETGFTASGGGGGLALGPLQSADVGVEFTPRSLGCLEAATLVISHEARAATLYLECLFVSPAGARLARAGRPRRLSCRLQHSVGRSAAP